MMSKRKVVALVIAVFLLLVGGLTYVRVARPFPCNIRDHRRRLWRTWDVWHRGELTDDGMLRELVAYAEIEPSFGEKPKFVEGNTSGNYATLRMDAIERIGEVNTPEAFEALCEYAVCDDRLKNAAAARALEIRGDKRAVPVLMKLMEIDDARQHGMIGLQACLGLRALTKLAGQEAAPLLREFLAGKRRVFRREVQRALFKLEHDISKPINVERHLVTIKLPKTAFKRGEEMMLDYSATAPVGTRLGKLSAFGTTVLIDGNVVKSMGPDVYLGGYSSHGSVSLSDLSPGEHTLTVKITGTDKSASAAFIILEGIVEMAP